MDYITEVHEILNAAYCNWDYLEKDNLYERICNAKYVCYFGLGKCFMDTYPVLKRDNFFNGKADFLCDNDPNKWGKEFYGIKCISPDELLSIRDNVAVIIMAVTNRRQVYEQLSNMGIKHIAISQKLFYYDDIFKYRNKDYLIYIKDKILKLLDLLYDELSKETVVTALRNRFALNVGDIDYQKVMRVPEYFTDDIFAFRTDECFVDAGAYTGDTIQEFLQLYRHGFEQIYAFEMDPLNFTKLEQGINKLDNNVSEKIKIFNKGVWNKSEVLTYVGGGTGARIFNTPNTTKFAYLDSLDNILGNQKVTFLKMDIEGSEINALHGASKIISEQKPKLAICVYHKFDDLWDIPILINELCPQYKIYIRHHEVNDADTICYATID